MGPWQERTGTVGIPPTKEDLMYPLKHIVIEDRGGEIRLSLVLCD
jgi:hypothetical protein